MNPCVDYCYYRHGKQYSHNCDIDCEYAKAISENKALKETIATNREVDKNMNKLLTLDELWEMDGEPIWVEYIGINHNSEWYILCVDRQEAINRRGGFVSMLYYGKTWIAYRTRRE